MTRIFTVRTWRAIKFDLHRLRCRISLAFHPVPHRDARLHLGCGARHVPGFLNCDIRGSEFDIDLGSGRLPWEPDSFTAIVCQHVIEHLDIRWQLPQLLREVRRILKIDGEFWVSTPDMAAICRKYIGDDVEALLDDRCSRWPNFDLGGLPKSQIMNELFHQEGEHLNLFDFELLEGLLRTAGFRTIERTSERQLIDRFQDFPLRNDEAFSLYVRARP